jgi:demethylmenaquinone methyltransferase/2-methoxy-6-polyprenyl-1,4-benzoquinol methylase
VFCEQGEGRASKVDELFSTIARRYDLINDLQSLGLHRSWKRRVLGLADARSGLRALDVCCGTGDLAIGFAQRGAEVVGLDFNQAMLDMAVRRLSSNRASRISFVHGDAQSLPFADNSFEAVTIGYGLRNLASWETGLSEMARVARPGGRLVSLDFGKPDNLMWRSIYFSYLRIAVPCLARLAGGRSAAYAYILESLRNYPAQQGVAAQMKNLGLRGIRVISLLGGMMAINFGEKPD